MGCVGLSISIGVEYDATIADYIGMRCNNKEGLIEHGLTSFL